MSKVDNRIVKMSFDNGEFERGASKSMATLDKLSQSLQMKGAKDGLSSVQGAIDRMNFSSFQGGIDGISKSFLSMSTIGITALSNITNKAVNAGLSLAKSLTIDAKTAGFQEYELKMGAIQTIMAGSGQSLEVVNQKLKELNDYSDETIYSFADMTQNIGKFTNAGVSLDQSVASIKGIANVAALSGANAEEASRSMYNFAQAISSGAVRLEDWKSIELANMGTVEFKQQLIDAAVAAGTLTKAGDGLYKTLQGTDVSAVKFNQTLQDQWLTSGVLVDTLGKYADKNTDIGKRASDAAQDIKTFTQLIGTLRENAGSGWAETFEILIGDFNEAKDLWTSVNSVVGKWVENSSDARNNLLRNWKDLGGRQAVVDGLKNAFTALGNILRPIGEAFRAVFPASTGETLVKLSTGFRDFTAKLKINEATIQAIKSTFQGLFAVFSIVKQVLSGVAGLVASTFGALTSGLEKTGGALDITAKIGEFFTNIDSWLKEGDRLSNFFQKWGDVIAMPIRFLAQLRAALLAIIFGGSTPFLDTMTEKFEGLGPIIDTVRGYLEQFYAFVQSVGNAIAAFFNFGDSGKNASDGIKTVNASLEDMQSPLELLKGLWESLKEGFSRFVDAAGPFLEKLLDGFNSLKDGVVDFAKGLDAFDFVAALDLALLIGVLAWLKKSMKDIVGVFKSLGGVFDSAAGTIDQVTANLKTMQQGVRAEIIMKIAIALTLLAASLWLLSTIEPKKLAMALGALVFVVIIVQKLIGKLNDLYEEAKLKDTAKLAAIGTGLIALALGLLILSAALALLGAIPTENLIKGLVTTTVVIAGLVAMAKALEKSGGAGDLIKAAVALGILGAALMLLAGAIMLFSFIDPGTLASGLIKIAISMVLISTALKLFPKSALKDAAALLIVSVALLVLAAALKAIASIGVGDMIKTALMLAATLTIISFAMTMMNGSLSGAGALFIVSAALLALSVALKILAGIPWQGLLLGLGAIIALLVIIGVASIAFSYIAPAVTAMAIAFLLLGAAALLGGLGLMALGAGLAALAATGAAGIAILTATIIGVAQLIPFIMYQIGLGLVAFASVVQKAAPELGAAFGAILKACLDEVRKAIPQLGEIVEEFIATFLEVIRAAYPDIIDTGWQLIQNFVDGIRDNVPNIVRSAIDIMINFMQALEDKLPEVAQQAFDTVIAFLNGLSDAIDENSEALGRAGGRLIKSIIKGMLNAITGGASEVLSGMVNMAKGALNAAKEALGINSPSKEFMKVGAGVVEGFVMGIDGSSGQVEKSTRVMGEEAIKNMQATLSDIYAFLDTEAEMNPVITPVLDLTRMEKDIPRLDNLAKRLDVGASMNYNQAASLTNARVVPENATATSSSSTTPVIQFEQHNYSPKALSAVDIYRQTKNQLSLAKEALRV